MPPRASTPSFGLRFRSACHRNAAGDGVVAFRHPWRWESGNGSGPKVGNTQCLWPEHGITQIGADCTQAQDDPAEDVRENSCTEARHQDVDPRPSDDTIAAPLVAPGDRAQ